MSLRVALGCFCSKLGRLVEIFAILVVLHFNYDLATLRRLLLLSRRNPDRTAAAFSPIGIRLAIIRAIFLPTVPPFRRVVIMPCRAIGLAIVLNARARPTYNAAPVANAPLAIRFVRVLMFIFPS